MGEPLRSTPAEIIANIDQGLRDAGVLDADDHILFVTDDRLRMLEDEVWLDLNESVQQGWRTQAEAEDAFMDWRMHYRAFGAPAVRSSQVEGMTRQEAFDRRARH